MSMRKIISFSISAVLIASIGIFSAPSSHAAINLKASCASWWGQTKTYYGNPPLGQMNKIAGPGFASYIAQTPNWDC